MFVFYFIFGLLFNLLIQCVVCVVTGENVEHTSLCHVEIPKYIEEKIKIYHHEAKDPLDSYMTAITGCRFMRIDEVSSAFSSEIVFHEPIVQVFAIRSSSWASIKVTWNIYADNFFSLYTIEFDLFHNKTTTKIVTRQFKRYQSVTPVNKTSTNEEYEQYTSHLLFGDNYQPLYIELDEDKITFGKLCAEPLIVENIHIEAGVNVAMKFNINSHGSILYGCPYNQADIVTHTRHTDVGTEPGKFPTTFCIIIAACVALAVCIYALILCVAKKCSLRKRFARQIDNISMSPLEEDTRTNTVVPASTKPAPVYDEPYVPRINNINYTSIYELRRLEFGTIEEPGRYPRVLPKRTQIDNKYINIFQQKQGNK